MQAIRIDIEELIVALESQYDSGESYLDKETGQLVLISDYMDYKCVDYTPDQVEENPGRYLYIEPMKSGSGWDIMDDFTQSIVTDREVQEALERALNGKKPFRSFKDTLLDFPEIRKQWFTYHNERMEKIARDWLEENDILFEVVDLQESVSRKP